MIPEGLEAIVTITSAWAWSKMARNNAITRPALRRNARLRHRRFLRQDRHVDQERTEMTLAAFSTAGKRDRFFTDSKDRPMFLPAQGKKAPKSQSTVLPKRPSKIRRPGLKRFLPIKSNQIALFTNWSGKSPHTLETDRPPQNCNFFGTRSSLACCRRNRFVAGLKERFSRRSSRGMWKLCGGAPDDNHAFFFFFYDVAMPILQPMVECRRRHGRCFRPVRHGQRSSRCRRHGHGRPVAKTLVQARFGWSCNLRRTGGMLDRVMTGSGCGLYQYSRTG